MTRYADPQRCPDCRGPIQFGARSCPTCDLPLSGPLAGRLFSTLAQADELLHALRVEASVVPAAPVPAAPAPVTPRAPSRLSAASVPKILLGLGALCLLVAAMVFLAVTWSVMGVAGRTATLVGFTVLAGLLAGWLAHRNLRAAAESLALVSLGLLAFDLFGARDSGWFGDIGTPGFLVLLGAVLAFAGATAAIAVRRTPAGDLVGAEIVAALGIATLCAGVVDGDWFAQSAALTVGVLLAAGAAVLADRARLVVLTLATGAIAGFVWLLLLATSFERAVMHPTGHELWVELEAWPLVVSALLVGGLALVRPFPATVRVGALATAELVLAVAALIPFAQGTGTRLTLAVLVVLAAACALTWFSRGTWALAPAVTAAAGGVWMLGVGFLVSLSAFSRVAEAGGELWDGEVSGRLPAAYDGLLEPWLLPVAVAALIGTGIVLARATRSMDRVAAPLADPVHGLALLAAATVGTVASYPVPVWLVCALMLLPALALVAWALLRRDASALVVGAVFLAGALATGLYDEWLTAAALLVTLVLSTFVHLRWPSVEVAVAVGVLVPASLGASVWTWGALADLDGTWTALVALLVLATLVLLLASDGMEAGAAVTAFVLGLAGVAAAPYPAGATWTAVYLTVAGVAVSTMALLRADRRLLGWVGGLLLAMASWVRLWDVGVQTPEAYTLPAAVALGLVGLVHLRRDPAAGTMTALGSGLGLALVPSLLWVLWEPATERSLLLGAACLLLVVAGLRMRWTAPVVFAATVGALVVLRHAGPFVDQAVPRWVLIAATGAVMIGMGITWERRIQEARAVVGYVRALR